MTNNEAIVLLTNLYIPKLSKPEQEAIHLAIATIKENEKLKTDIEILKGKEEK